MKLIIRDDDISYFTEPKKLEEIYAGLWDILPINLAVIPKVSHSEIKGCRQTKQKKYYPINEKKPLVLFLKKKMKEGKIVIWQHGYTHKNYGDLFEFERSTKTLLKEILYGKQILEKTFNAKIDTFVAPHDSFSREAILAVEQAGFKYISRSFSPRIREFRKDYTYWISGLRLFFFLLFHGRNDRYPRPLRFGKHIEFFNYRIGQIKKSRIKYLFEKHRKGVLCITVHHQHITDEKKRILRYIVEKYREEYL